MKLIFCLPFLLFQISINKTFAQGEAAVYFLYFNPSPQSNGLGWTGVSVPNNDAFGFHYNPAMLGYFSQKNNLTLHAYPGSVEWAGIDQIKYNSFGFNIGYNFTKELNGINLSTGAGFIRNSWNWDLPFNDLHYFNAYGIGASINYYITVALGMTLKSIHSEFGMFPVSGTMRVPAADVNAIDYGFLLILPVTDLFANNINLSNNSTLIPEFNYSLGYSRLNIGDEIYYVDPAQSDPLPLTARLGHTFNFKLNYEGDGIFLNTIEYNLILEADDILIRREIIDERVETSYQGMLGDISFGKHLIQLKGDDKVVVHKGHSIKFLETITILKGSFAGRSYDSKTHGIIISSSGLIKWLAFLTENHILKFAANHVELRYLNSSLFAGTPIETDFTSFSVSFFNYSFN